MKKKLRISSVLSLPADAVTSTIVVYGGKGMGKCLGPEVEVLHFDGHTSRADEVRVGDLLMGPDSKPRRVTGTNRSHGPMFTILPTKGEPWRCNDVHVLTVKNSKTGEVSDIPLDQFLTQSRHFQQFHLLFSTGVEFQPAEELPIDPYFLGVWYGDGDKGIDPDLGLVRVAITSADREIAEMCNATAARMGLRVGVTIDETNAAQVYRIVNDRGGGNPFLDLMRSVVGMSLAVPRQYLTASRADRLAFLAGWLDADGSLECGCFDFVQKRRDWADAVMFLTRSLGFRATVSPKIINGTTYWRICISGNVSEVPTRLAHKRAAERQQRKDPLRTGFRAIPDGDGEYFGFTLDGDGRFLLGDFTVTHNTNFASVLVEEFAATGLRFAVIDPMGVWWGLRHDESGKGAGVKVLILGGRHGDMPITPESGAIVADLVVDEDTNVIVDISRRADGSMWSIGERVRFVTDYAKRLYQRQGEKRRPIMQVIDEAARFAPQVVRAGDMDVAKCMGAIAVIVEEGRNVGLGVTLVTQRSARLNKDVAELADCMIAFRTLGPNSVRAVLDWLGEHVEKARLKDIATTLRELPRGSALVVSPGWLEFEGIVAMRKRRTFDSSDTPKAGKQRRVSGTGAKPDLEKYRARMAAVVERAKENDPKALKAEVAKWKKAHDALQAGMEREIRQKLDKDLAKVKEKIVVKEVEVVRPADLRRLEALVKKIDKLILRITGTNADLELHLSGLRAEATKLQEVATRVTQLRGKKAGALVGEVLKLAPEAPIEKSWSKGDPLHHAYLSHPPKPTKAAKPVKGVPSTAKTTKPTKAAKAPPRTTSNGTSNGDAASIGGAERRILEACAWMEAIGQPDADSSTVAFLAGYTVSGHFTNLRGKLRSAGLVEYPSGGTVRLTAAGRDAAPDVSRPTTIAALHEAVFDKLDNSAGRILKPLIEVYPKSLTAEESAEASGYTVSGHFTNLRGRLHTMGLVTYPRPNEVRASDLLFPAGLS